MENPLYICSLMYTSYEWKSVSVESCCLCFPSQWECTWFVILCSSFLLLLFWAYFWLVAQNDFNEFNWWVSQSTTGLSIVVGWQSTTGLMRLWTAGCVVLWVLGVTRQSSPFFWRMNMFYDQQRQVKLYLFTLQVSIQPLWRMEGWDHPHSCIHHRGIQLHHLLNGNRPLHVCKVSYSLVTIQLNESCFFFRS